MQGLMVKLLNVDTPGERALRVVAYFDQLVSNTPDLDAVVRATAVIADCPAGLELPVRGSLIRYSSEGLPLVAAPRGAVRQGSIRVGSDEHGTIWLERGDVPRELDEFIVERFGLTVQAVIARQQPVVEADASPGLSDPALAQLLVSDSSTEADRSRAARLIGLLPSQSVQLIAVETPSAESGTVAARALRGAWQRPVYVAALSRHLSLVIAVGSEPVDWAAQHHITGRAASGPVVDLLDAPRSWAEARGALRFAGAASPWPRQMDSTTLGVLRLLVELSPSVVAGNSDIIRMDELASSSDGAQSLDILDQYLHADSLRSAARTTQFHHSSLQSRISRIGRSLQLDLRTPAGRERAAISLLLWRAFRRSEDVG